MDARLLRLSLRLSQADLASRVGTSQTSISAFERGSRRISPGLAQRILSVLVTQGVRASCPPEAKESRSSDPHRVDQ